MDPASHSVPSVQTRGPSAWRAPGSASSLVALHTGNWQHWREVGTDVSTEVEKSTSSADSNPLESIRQFTDDGFEFWSARDLMPELGYAQWQNFAEIVEKAKISASNQGLDADVIFREGKKYTTPAIPEQQGPRKFRRDYHLSRFACYLVAMNGDPRKAEIAAAQVYFATMTRQAELYAATEPPQRQYTELELAQRHVAALERIQELAPKAEAHEIRKGEIVGNMLYVVRARLVLEASQLSSESFWRLLRAMGALSDPPSRVVTEEWVTNGWAFNSETGTPLFTVEGINEVTSRLRETFGKELDDAQPPSLPGPESSNGTAGEHHTQPEPSGRGDHEPA